MGRKQPTSFRLSTEASVVAGTMDRRERGMNVVAAEAWPLTDALPDAVKNAAGQRAHEALQRCAAPPSHNNR